MRDYIRRLLIAAIMALCVGLLFLGGTQTEAKSPEAKDLQKGWIWPTDGIISDTYGTRDGEHKGLDIAGDLHSPIIAVEDGVIEKSYYSNTYGHVVFIKHPSNFVTVYAHLNKRLVKSGQNVKQGDTIGTMGKTGESTGVHLHFETHQTEWSFDKKNAFNPELLLGKAEVGFTVLGGRKTKGEETLEASSYPKESKKHYVVRTGDTLTSIARENNQTVPKLMEINKLQSDLIKPNQILIVTP